jgi:hypothetical protein
LKEQLKNAEKETEVWRKENQRLEFVVFNSKLQLEDSKQEVARLLQQISENPSPKIGSPPLPPSIELPPIIEPPKTTLVKRVPSGKEQEKLVFDFSLTPK